MCIRDSDTVTLRADNGIRLKQENGVVDIGLKYMAVDTTVSYTHLDVYKRQVIIPNHYISSTIGYIIPCPHHRHTFHIPACISISVDRQDTQTAAKAPRR